MFWYLSNRFGHVSPTNVHHVLADLGEHNIIVLKPKDATQGAEECPIGIESTVAKIDVEEKKVRATLYVHVYVTINRQ